MATIPIALRTRNRPVFLDTTLKSLWYTNLPNDAEMLVLDDCSDDPLTVRYLRTTDTIELPEPFKWRTDPKFVNNAAAFKTVNRLHGIANRIEVVQPDTRRGVRHGVFWCIRYMMNRFRDAPAIILIEADSIFHAEWYTRLLEVFELVRDQKGPNGDCLGLLTCYDRMGRTLQGPPFMWRRVTKLANGNWGCAKAIGGVLYLVDRKFYMRAFDEFERQQRGNPGKVSGDTMLQGCAGTYKCNLATTYPSYCQHIGYHSLAWPTKGWRYTRNFKRPVVFENRTKDGTLFSDEW